MMLTNLGDFDELIVVVMAMKKGFFLEDHPSQHAAQRPQIKGIVIFLEVNQQFRSLEIAGSHTNIVLSACSQHVQQRTKFTHNMMKFKKKTWMIEFCKAPIDESEFSFLVVDHDVMWFDITVHDALGVTKIQSLQQLKQIVSDVIVCQHGIQSLEIGVVNVFKDKGGSLGDWVTDNIEKLNYIFAPT
jgi:hypothetical protein